MTVPGFGNGIQINLTSTPAEKKTLQRKKIKLSASNSFELRDHRDHVLVRAVGFMRFLRVT